MGLLMYQNNYANNLVQFLDEYKIISNLSRHQEFSKRLYLISIILFNEVQFKLID